MTGVPLCPLCKAETTLQLRARDLNRRVSRQEFDYHRCGACGLVFLSPVPPDLGAYYPPEYYRVPAPGELAARAELDRYKIELVRRFAAGGRLLEIGPSYGAFAKLAKEAGYDYEGMERDGACCRFLREVAGVAAIETSDPAAALRQQKPYNAIVLWQVAEHLPNLWAVLDAAARALLPNGILLVATPNPESFQFRVLRSYWAHLDAPRHVMLVPPGLLTQHMQAAGLTPEFLTHTDRGSLGWNRFGWRVSLAHILGVNPNSYPLRALGLAISWLMLPLERTGGRGAAYTAVFRK